MRRRALASVLAAAAVAAASVVAAVPSSQATPARKYVALGDSYSAASGVLPVDLNAPVNCLRSTRNYPKVIAARIGANLLDVTCGAAETKHYFTAEYQNVPPQLDALSKDTQLVTMTIGGNDSSVFINTILQCGTAGLSTAGQGSPCKDKYGSSFQDTLAHQDLPQPRQGRSRPCTAKAPKAKVAILSYPWIMPKTVGCFDKMPDRHG